MASTSGFRSGGWTTLEGPPSASTPNRLLTPNVDHLIPPPTPCSLPPGTCSHSKSARTVNIGVQAHPHCREACRDPTAAYVSAGKEPYSREKSRSLAVGLTELQSRRTKTVAAVRSRSLVGLGHRRSAFPVDVLNKVDLWLPSTCTTGVQFSHRGYIVALEFQDKVFRIPNSWLGNVSNRSKGTGSRSNR